MINLQMERLELSRKFSLGSKPSAFTNYATSALFSIIKKNNVLENYLYFLIDNICSIIVNVRK